VTEPLDFGPRIAMRRWGPVKVNPMPMLARASYEKARAWLARPKNLQPRPLQPMPPARRHVAYREQTRKFGDAYWTHTARQQRQIDRKEVRT